MLLRPHHRHQPGTIEKSQNNTFASELQYAIRTLSDDTKSKILHHWHEAFEKGKSVDFQTFKLFAGTNLLQHSWPILHTIHNDSKACASQRRKRFLKNIVTSTECRFSKASDRRLWYVYGIRALLGILIITGTTSLPWVTTILPLYAQILLYCAGGLLCLGLIMHTVQCLYHTIHQDAFMAHECQAILQAYSSYENQPCAVGTPRYTHDSKEEKKGYGGYTPMGLLQ